MITEVNDATLNSQDSDEFDPAQLFLINIMKPTNMHKKDASIPKALN